jgi:hypothetical protein
MLLLNFTALGLREVVLRVSDAHKGPRIRDSQLQEVHKFFGGITHQNPIVEFP